MKFYIDFDDCLCETGRAFAVLAAELFGKQVPYEEMKHFNLRDSFDLTEAQYAELLGHEPELLADLEETPGASEVINEWIGSGHEVSIITGRPFSTYKASRAWLDRHGLRDARLYYLDKYGRGNGQTESRFILRPDDYFRMTFDYAVEDSPNAFRFFDHLPALKVLVFDRPWNRRAGFPNDNYRRCFSWKEIRENAGGPG